MRLLVLVTLAFTLAGQAQPYLVGNRSITFFDASRNRNIPTNLYYPGVAAGSSVEVEAGAFPVLVVGHGFVMSTDAYANLWNHFVPRGYIVALPTTEGGFSPSHSAFGLDLAFVASALQAANADDASPFHQHVAPTSALMGHSMGGGASFLGAAGNSAISTVVNLAAAETNPSAVAACSQVQVPTLMFAGGNDCVTPIAQHQQPMYAALTTPCRAFVNILGGGHCYFAESNFNCSFGELTCSPSPTISRSAQHDVVNDFATLWLDHFLRGDQAALPAFLDSVTLSTRVSAVADCALATSVFAPPDESPFIMPTVATDRLRVTAIHRSQLRIYGIDGSEKLSAMMEPGERELDVQALPASSYVAVITEDGRRRTQRLVIAR